MRQKIYSLKAAQKVKYIHVLLFMLLFFTGCEDSEIANLPATNSLDSSAAPGGGSSNSGSGGVITAGEWNDLQNWKFWQDLIKKPEFMLFPNAWNLYTTNRIGVLVVNEQGQKLRNMPVSLLNANQEVVWESQTDNKGQAELWINLDKDSGKVNLADYKLKVNSQILVNPALLKEGINGFNQVVLRDQPTQLAPDLEVAFVVDATGSMGDELQFLKEELLSVIDRVKANNPDAKVKTSALFYRDKEDEYLTRRSAFSTDAKQTIDFIKAQRADGGGDFPEAVHTALTESINELQWSGSATSKILFLVLDAPPHAEPAVLAQLQQAVSQASKFGIKIIPVTASGIDKSTEYLMRVMAMSTNGTYVFITNHSGIGDSHLEASVGSYKVEYLNDLMVRLLNNSLQ